MKFLSEDILVLVVKEDGEPIAVVQQDFIETKDNVSITCYYNNELGRKNVQRFLDKYPIKK